MISPRAWWRCLFFRKEKSGNNIKYNTFGNISLLHNNRHISEFTEENIYALRKYAKKSMYNL